MNRSSLGGFGRDLPADELAQALAALGVIFAADGAVPQGVGAAAARLAELVAAPREIVPWRLPPELGALASVATTTPRELAGAWRDGVSAPGRRPRLCVELPPPALFDAWLLQELARPAVGAASVFFRAEPAEIEVGLSWPVRFGFLEDADSRALEAEISRARPYPELFALAPLADQPDVLLLPHGLRAALTATLDRPGRERADCAVVLGGIDEDPSAAHRHLALLRDEVATGGVAVLDVLEANRVRFVASLIEALSHDLALDEALFEAAAAAARPPLLVASRTLAEVFRISAAARALAAELGALPPEQPLSIDDRTKDRLGIARTAATGPEVGGELRERSADFRFEAESGEATDLARIRRSAEPQLGPPGRRLRAHAMMRRAMAPPPKDAAPSAPARHLQAEVFEPGPDGTLVSTQEALVAGAPYVLSFLIGKPAPGRAVAPRPFDETRLPRSDAGHDLAVVFAEAPAPGEIGAPQVGTLHLPPEGDSSSCTFAFRTKPGAGSFEGRVTILFGNRVLETARVEARVASGAPRGPLELTLALLEVDGVENAGRRPAVDGALIFNETTSGDHALTGVSDGVAVIASLAGVQDAVLELGEAIADFTDLQHGARGLPAKEMAKLLSAVAQPGRMIWDHVEKALPVRMREARRLHLVEGAIGALFPVELLYRAPAPVPGAKPCPGGPPTKRRPCTACPEGLEGRTVVCANQFWGLRTVFEREAHPLEVPAGAVATVRRGAGPRGVVKLDAALLATSELVDAEAPKKTKPEKLPSAAVQGALADLVGPGKLRRVRSREEWETAVKEVAPGLIVLVVHSTKDGRSDAIEIAGELVRFSNIETVHLVAPGGPAPIVLLVGCSTAVARSGALSLVPRLVGKGACAVVATLAPVLGRYAGPAAAELVRALAARRGAATLGEALLEVKRGLVSHGEPIGMCLVAYGDASVSL